MRICAQYQEEDMSIPANAVFSLGFQLITLFIYIGIAVVFFVKFPPSPSRILGIVSGSVLAFTQLLSSGSMVLMYTGNYGYSFNMYIFSFNGFLHMTGLGLLLLALGLYKSTRR
jgi:hypothetical protein